MDDRNVLTLADLESLAESVLSQEAWAYYAGGAGDERTLRENVEAWGAARSRGTSSVWRGAISTGYVPSPTCRSSSRACSRPRTARRRASTASTRCGCRTTADGSSTVRPDGVVHAAAILRAELETAMALLGTPTLRHVTRSHLSP